MTGYMMKEEKRANTVRLLVRTCGKAQDRRKNASAACERFVQSAELLPEGEYLSWQMTVDAENAISNIVFSSPGVQIQAEDYAWIFEKYASVKPAGTDARTADLFSEGRKVYTIVRRPGEEIEKKESSNDYYYNYGYPDRTKTEHFMDLLKMLQAAGRAYIRVIAEAASGQGMLLLSLPDRIPLRMKTALALTFPSSIVREVYASELRKPESVPVLDLLDGIVELQQAFIYCKKQKACMDDGRDDRETDSLRTEDDMIVEFEDDAEEDYEFSDLSDEDDEPEYIPYTPIEKLPLSVRSYNCLKRAGVESVEELRMMNDEELMSIRNLGRRSMEEIKQALTSGPRPEETDPASAGNCRAMLKELIGLADVKEQVKKIEAYAKLKQDMEASGNQTEQMVLNMEFVGNPGTAKTTVARILAGIFYEMGLLSSKEIVETGRADLVGLYTGHTADQVRNIFRQAKGRLLFIDEAYALTDDRKGSFGDEAINTIVQEMENHRGETIVIFAGYREEMEEFFSRNPGLRSRTPFRIAFDDYSAEEMEQIVELEAGKRGFTIQEQAKDKVTDLCNASKTTANAGNGRFCRNLLEKAILNYAFRVYSGESADADRDYILTEADFTIEGLLEPEKEATPFGFRI